MVIREINWEVIDRIKLTKDQSRIRNCSVHMVAVFWVS